jgi:hypothetical protein
VPELLVGQGHGDIHRPHAQIPAGPQVGFPHPAPYQQAALQTQPGQVANAVPLLFAHGRNADFQFRYAQRVQIPGDGALFVLSEGHARRLFAVAQGGVVDHDGLGNSGHGSGFSRSCSTGGITKPMPS